MAKPKATQVNKSSSMSSFKATSAVTIRVGTAPKTEDFIAHESFLTSRSEFFRRAMNGNWKESETRIINLPDDDVKFFAHYINYVYTGQLPTTSNIGLELTELPHAEFTRHVQDQYGTIFGVFVLSEKLRDTTTKNAMMEAALVTARLQGVMKKRHIPSSGTVNRIYNGTPAGSPARRFVTDMWTVPDVGYIFSLLQGLHEEFVKDLGKSIEDSRWPMGNIIARKGIAAYQDGKEEC